MYTREHAPALRLEAFESQEQLAGLIRTSADNLGKYRKELLGVDPSGLNTHETLSSILEKVTHRQIPSICMDLTTEHVFAMNHVN